MRRYSSDFISYEVRLALILLSFLVLVLRRYFVGPIEVVISGFYCTNNYLPITMFL